MTHDHTLPPAWDGVLSPGFRDVLRLVWWSQRAAWHQAGRGGPGAPAALALALLWWPTWPLHVLARWAMVTDPGARYYLSPDRSAVVAVVAGDQGWRLTEHLCARPGSGLGAPWRRRVLQHLVPAADVAQVTLSATTRSRRLVELYLADLPTGDVRVERSGQRWLLVRPPVDSTEPPDSDAAAPLHQQAGQEQHHDRH